MERRRHSPTLAVTIPLLLGVAVIVAGLVLFARSLPSSSTEGTVPPCGPVAQGPQGSCPQTPAVATTKATTTTSAGATTSSRAVTASTQTPSTATVAVDNTSPPSTPPSAPSPTASPSGTSSP